MPSGIYASQYRIIVRQFKLNEILFISVITKGVHENGVLRPMEKLNLRQGEEVEIEIKDAVLRTSGIIKLDPEIARAIADGYEFSVLVG